MYEKFNREIYKVSISNLTVCVKIELARKITNFSYVNLYYDKDKNTIGLKFKNTGDDCSYKLSNMQNNRIFAIKGFLNFYKIKERGDFYVSEELVSKIGHMWVINLNKKVKKIK